MSRATAIRTQIEASLAGRIQSALTPQPRIIRPVAATGIGVVDEVLEGGLPLGAITEMIGSECSGRTSLALSFIARMTQAEKVCAWVDVSNVLDPESAAAIGADLKRLLWVRCGVLSKLAVDPSSENSFSLPNKYFIPPPVKKGLHGGGFGSHPRGEVKGMSNAVGNLLRSEVTTERRGESQHRTATGKEISEIQMAPRASGKKRSPTFGKPWSRIDQALRVSDLLLQAGGFSAIVLDLGSIAPEHASRVPLATWFRYRAAAERSQASILLLTQYACAKSSAGLVLRLQPGKALREETTVFTGIEHCVEVARERFAVAPTNVIPLRKPSLSEKSATWQSRMVWAGCR
jgi:recombination protein RecA